jgi:hypothetical protein
VNFIRQGATHKVLIGPAVAVGDGFTPVTTLTLSGADEAEAILHDNGTTVSISGYTFAAITNADGYYHLTLQSGISGTVGHMTVVINDDSLILPIRADFTVLEEAVYDALFAASAPGYVANAPVNAAQFGGVAVPSDAGTNWTVFWENGNNVGGQTLDTYPATVGAAVWTNGTRTITGTDAGAFTAASFAPDAVDAAALSADAVTAIQSGLATAANLALVPTAAGNAAAVWAAGTRTLTAFSFATFPTNFGSLAITAGGVVSADVTAVNAVTIGGTGVLGDEWGPA